jgi:3-oxoadipate enol-lactonase
MFYTTADNKKLYYEFAGDPSAGSTLVLLNGLTQSTVSWSLFVEQLGKHYRILLVDFVFQGQSDKTGEWRDFDTHAGDVASLIRSCVKEKVAVIGLSYGSLVAQHLAVNHPQLVSRLVLLSTFAHKTPYYEAIENAWWQALEKGGYNLLLDVMLPSVLSEAYFDSPLVPIETMKQLRREKGQDSQALFALMRATRERGDYRPYLRKINCPCLIIQGEKDLLLPPRLAEEVHRNIPSSQLSILPAAGHTLNLERAGEVCAQILQFLADPAK